MLDRDVLRQELTSIEQARRNIRRQAAAMQAEIDVLERKRRELMEADEHLAARERWLRNELNFSHLRAREEV